jgi:hypothetical protein
MVACLNFLDTPLLLMTCPKHVFTHARNKTLLWSLVLKHVFLFAMFDVFIFFCDFFFFKKKKEGEDAKFFILFYFLQSFRYLMSFQLISQSLCFIEISFRYLRS